MKAKLKSKEDRQWQAYYVESHQVGPCCQVLPTTTSWNPCSFAYRLLQNGLHLNIKAETFQRGGDPLNSPDKTPCVESSTTDPMSNGVIEANALITASLLLNSPAHRSWPRPRSRRKDTPSSRESASVTVSAFFALSMLPAPSSFDTLVLSKHRLSQLKPEGWIDDMAVVNCHSVYYLIAAANP